jgi:Flp pilus assembly pilin Flp
MDVPHCKVAHEIAIRPPLKSGRLQQQGGSAVLGIFTNVELRVRESLQSARQRDEGAGVVEYLLLVLFIALVLVLALGFFSGRLGSAFSRAGNSIPS